MDGIEIGMELMLSTLGGDIGIDTPGSLLQAWLRLHRGIDCFDNNNWKSSTTVLFDLADFKMILVLRSLSVLRRPPLSRQ